MSDTLAVAQVLQILASLADDLESAKDRLNELDAAIGDGDMGISMARGFRSVREGLKDPPQDIRQILMKVGLILSNAAASTAGALLSTAFVRAAKEVQNPAEVTPHDIVRMVKAAEAGIQERGKAQFGDKTMLDAIVPARKALEGAVEEGDSLLGALGRAAAAAEQGVLATIEMRSAVGRASWLGERTVGHQDPGATAIALMLKSLVESVGQLTKQSAGGSMKVLLSLWASTPDFAGMKFPVKALIGTPESIAQQAVSLGYDGLEFMPDPENPPDPERMRKAMQNAGASFLVVNSGRMGSRELALLGKDRNLRLRSLKAFKNLIDFGAYLKARVCLGAECRGREKPGETSEETERITEGVFRELAEHAEKVGTVLMLEPTPFKNAYIQTVSEAVYWVKRINSPSFNLHFDIQIHLLMDPSLEHAIRAAEGRPNHIHMYEENHWPPGLLPSDKSTDWPLVARLLRETGFEGSCAVPLPPEGDVEAGARKSAEFLRRLFGGDAS